MDKNNILKDFMNMIENSWTYNRMTETEKEQIKKTFLKSIITQNAIKGTYKQRWAILQAIYEGVLAGCGYTDFNWREKEQTPF